MSYFINILANGDTLKFCDSYNVLIVFYLIKQILTLVSIVVPIVLIVMLCVDVFKAVVSGNINDEIKKMSGKIVKRVIMCFAFFLLPTIINLIASVIGFISYDATACWQNATEANIETLKNERENMVDQEEQEASSQAEEAENEKQQQSEETQN